MRVHAEMEPVWWLGGGGGGVGLNRQVHVWSTARHSVQKGGGGGGG